MARKKIPEEQKKKGLIVARYFDPKILQEKGPEILQKMKDAVKKIKI